MLDLKPIYKLSPITKFCCSIGAIPTSYLVSLSYEEQLIWLCDYLQNTVIPTLNKNGEAVTELQNLYNELKNYVDNYFINLDIQNEINKKLEEMLENGEFQEIFNKFFLTSYTFSYNNVDEMINDETLTENSRVITFGYHTKNDGGNCNYIISNTSNNKFGTISLANGKFAIPLYETLNVKAFGAYGDNIHDDTEIIQNIFNLAKENKQQDFYSGKSQIIFPTGKYKITSNLIMSPLTKIKTIGQVWLISYNIAGACLSIKPTNENIPYTPTNDFSYNKGLLIDGSEGGFIIWNNNILSSDSIGLEIGNDIELDINYRFNNNGFSNISISRFDTNLLINNNNLYCLSFTNCFFNLANCDIKIGKQYQSPNNAGERISFIDCNIVSSKIGVEYNTQGFETMFDSCSFDFLYCCFNTFGGNLTSMNNNDFANYAKIFCNNCRFEALAYENFQYIQINENDPFGLIYNENDKVLVNSELVENEAHTILELSNCFYYMSTNKKQIINSLPINNLYVNLSNFSIRANIGNTDADKLFIAGDLPIKVKNFSYINNGSQYLLSKKLAITSYPEFENLENGKIISNSEETVTDSFKNFQNITSTAKIDNEIPFSTSGKTLRIQASSAVEPGVQDNCPKFEINDNIFYHINANQDIYSTILFRTFQSSYKSTYVLDVDYIINFYDENKNLISNETISKYSRSQDAKYGCSYSQFITNKIPNNAKYFKINRKCLLRCSRGILNQQTFLITGLYTTVY